LDQEITVEGSRQSSRVPHSSFASLTSLQLSSIGRDIIKDLIAGLVAAVVLIGNIVSFGALMFPGDLSVGIPVVIWAMLVGSCIGGVLDRGRDVPASHSERH